MTDYALIRTPDLSIVRRWSGLPPALDLPDGRRIVSPVELEHLGLVVDGFMLVELVEEGFLRPGLHYTQGDDVPVFDVEQPRLTIVRTWSAWSPAEISAFEEARRESTAAENLDAPDAILRAAVLIILEDRNALAATVEGIRQAGANAASLAGFRSAMAALPPVLQYTPAQLRARIRSRLGAAS